MKGIPKLSILVATAGLLLIQTACAPVYVPNTRQTPLLDKKGELHAAVHTGTNGAHLQAAYAVSDRFGLVGGFSKSKNETEEDLSPDYHKHTLGELGVAYFRSLGRIGRLEALGGLGFGTAEAVDQYDFFGPQEVRAEGSYNNIFLQGNIGLETGVIETGVALRLNRVNFTQFETNSSTYNETEGAFFFEPALFGRLGWKNIKIEGQYGFSSPFDPEVAFDFQLWYFSLGIQFQINTL